MNKVTISRRNMVWPMNTEDDMRKLILKIKRRWTRWYFHKGYPSFIFGVPDGLPWHVRILAPYLYDDSAYWGCVVERVTEALTETADAIRRFGKSIHSTLGKSST
jgi:hypothetical protein